MHDIERPERLSQISTVWESLYRALDFAADPERQHLGVLLERYHLAAFRYLWAATGKEDVAADLFQEFAVKFLEGQFHRADPTKGRFRDYLKTSLINLVRKDSNRAAKMILRTDSALDLAASEVNECDEPDEVFLAGWRKTLLDRAWSNIAAVEMKTGTPYHTALKIRTNHPEDSSTQLARKLTELLHPSDAYTDAGVRKLLQRGREMMSELLVDEVARSIPTEDADIVEQEIIDLGFHAHCRQAMIQFRAAAGSIKHP